MNDDIQPPNLAKRSANFLKAMGKAMLEGFATVDDQQAEKRFSICQACRFYDGTICRHKQCGCEIDPIRKFASKVWLRSEDCPDRRWPRNG